MRTPVLLTILFLFYACQTQRPAAPTPSLEQSVAKGGPEILFLQLKVWKTADRYGAGLLQQRRVAGRLKRDLQGTPPAVGQWIVYLLDAKQQVVDQVSIPDPLEEHFETTDDQGRMRGVDVHKTEADCLIRVQYDPRFAAVRIEQIGTQQQYVPIISMNLQ